jgi:hypothetical protein
MMYKGASGVSSRRAVIRGDHWKSENRVHYVRDVTFDEDRSQVRTAGGPHIMASIRNLVMRIFRLLGFQYIPDAIRYFAMRLQEVFLLLGI